jgi:hypothetical protein
MNEPKVLPISQIRGQGFLASQDSFVVSLSVVLRLNFCAINALLGQAQNRLICV